MEFSQTKLDLYVHSLKRPVLGTTSQIHLTGSERSGRTMMESGPCVYNTDVYSSSAVRVDGQPLPRFKPFKGDLVLLNPDLMLGYSNIEMIFSCLYKCVACWKERQIRFYEVAMCCYGDFSQDALNVGRLNLWFASSFNLLEMLHPAYHQRSPNLTVINI